jgi:lysophospholipase L1-like esterase
MKNTISLLIIALIFPIFVTCGDTTGDRPQMHDTRAAMAGEPRTWGDSIPWGCGLWIDGLNRAYPGDTSADMLEYVKAFSELDAPGHHRILIGTNDIRQGIQGTMPDRLEEVFGYMQGTVEVLSILPRSDENMNAEIVMLNERIRALTELWGHTYRDVHDDFLEPGSPAPLGFLADEYTYDGLHLNSAGCGKLFG